MKTSILKCFPLRRVALALSLAIGLGLAVSPAMAQYLSAYPNAFNAGCNGNDIDRTSGFNAEARIDPEWATITSSPTILEGTVATPGELYSPEQAGNQAPSEVAESDIPWTHYTHDKTSNVLPDPEYQSLLASWINLDIDANGNIIADNPGSAYLLIDVFKVENNHAAAVLFTLLDNRISTNDFGSATRFDYDNIVHAPPFNAADDFALIDQQVNAEPTHIRELDPSLPQAIDDVIVRALEKHPDDRYGSAAEMAADLERAAQAIAPRSA